MMPERAAFLRVYRLRGGNPVHEMAIIGVSPLRRRWYRLHRRVFWPRCAAFFPGWEPVTDWLVREGY